MFFPLCLIIDILQDIHLTQAAVLLHGALSPLPKDSGQQQTTTTRETEVGQRIYTLGHVCFINTIV